MAADANVVISTVTIQAIGIYLLQRMKAATWIPFITKETPAINRLVAAFLAAVGAVGIHAAWNGAAHTLTITGLDVSGIAIAAWAWTKNFVWQQMIYHGVVKNGSNGILIGSNPQGMMGLANKGKVLGALLVVMLATGAGGCAPHVPTTAGVPARNATPIEKALAYNAGLAEGNKTIAQAVVDANSQTPPLIETEYANKLLVMQSRVADFDRQLTPLLADSATVTANSARIELLLDEIKQAASGVQGDVGIKNATTQKKISDAIAQVYQFADLALTALTTARLLK